WPVKTRRTVTRPRTIVIMLTPGRKQVYSRGRDRRPILTALLSRKDSSAQELIVPPGGVRVRRVFARIRSETQSAFSAEAPVHSAARRYDAGHLSADVLLQNRPPG